MAFSIMRGKILAQIKELEPVSVSELCRSMNHSKGSAIYRYLTELKSRELIVSYKEKNKTMLKTTQKAKPLILSVYNILDNLKEYSSTPKKEKAKT